MEEVDRAVQTLFAERLQRCLDAEFDAEYREHGTFVRKQAEGRENCRFQWSEGEKVRNRYVGPVSDPDIAQRVQRFADLKAGFKRRQPLVRALIAADLPTPEPLSGRIVEAMWRVGLFRLRGVLVGTLALQT